MAKKEIYALLILIINHQHNRITGLRCVSNAVQDKKIIETPVYQAHYFYKNNGNDIS